MVAAENEEKAQQFRSKRSDDALNIYKTFGLQETLTNPTIAEILEKFDNHFKPFKNVIYRRYNFFSEVQEKNQSFDDFVTKVKNKDVDCDFGDLTESLIRDRIILGVLDKNLTERYLQDPELTLSKAIALGRAAESSRTQLKEIKEEVLKIARENGLKFDKTKTQLMQPSVRYLGHIVSTEGIRPLESKRDLKLQLTSAPCLRYFDPKLDIEITTDASSNGLGAVLQQQGVPITFLSTALSAAQKKYSQIEKELLAVYFGCKRNHLYLYGRKFTAFTDHKPLLTIMKKPMVDLSPRLQRLVLQLQHYDFDLKYIPGKKLYTADALSRDYIANDLFITPEIEISQNNQVLMVTYSNNRHQDLVEATNNDPVLQEVKNYIENGWPIHKKTMNPLVKSFWDIKEELFEWEGLWCRGVKLVIPEKRRNHILSLLHKAHRGINSTLSLARSTFYWPGMCQEVEEFVKKCRICQKYSRNNTKEPLIPHETGNYPFKKIGVDLFEIEGRKYLGIVDYYTKYPEVFELRSTKAEMVIEKLKEVFARFGVPEIMMTDNGPPFQSTEMMEFAKEWNVTHPTSSSRFPQSNGMIERTIQTLKSTIIKCQQSKQDIYQALLFLRNTEHNSLPSPAVMLYGRKQRLFFPMKTTLMNESRICEDSTRKQHEANQSRMKFYFNRHARDLPSLENGQTVLVRKEKQWSSAKVIAPGVHPRSYLLEDIKGSVLRRNRRDLRPADTLSRPTEKESPPEKQEQLDPQPSTSSQSEETSATTRTRCGRLVKPLVRVAEWTRHLPETHPAPTVGAALTMQCHNQGRLGNQMAIYAALLGLAHFNHRTPYVLNCNYEKLEPYFKITAVDIISINVSEEHSYDLDEIINRVENYLVELSLVYGQSTTFVSIHVRRTDYNEWLKRPIRRGRLVDMKYFNLAMKYFEDKYEKVVFVVVSDDRKWCKENFGNKSNAVLAPPASEPAVDMALISRCHHHIMSYGSFGFWGAYLGGGTTVFFADFLPPDSTFLLRRMPYNVLYLPEWVDISTAPDFWKTHSKS
ncbi:K02A2.6-like [Cordylochernes scorpioides]|uniref:RNA-directed DNA polymerase n=1 Tax=Cordylochernes scorpioides TaxID=51811 RepID=A0ABY6JZR9_9ARAC|nr:K02A2.6-like [Cordylochernes scorpioides]